MTSSNNSVSDPADPSASHCPALQRSHQPGLYSTVLAQGNLRELHLTLLPLPGEVFPAMLQRLHRILREADARIVKQDIFGPLALYGEALTAIEKSLGTPLWPITWTDGAGCGDNQMGGMQVTAVAGVPVEPIHLEGRIIGAIYQDSFARHYLLGDLRPPNPTASRNDQTSQTYEQLETALGLKGMTMFNVVRTWFFLDGILSWYDDFNRVRTSFYQERKLIERLVPASTGVGIKNPHGTALVLGAWAIEPLGGALTMSMLPSPLQCPAPSYGSCFSRAVEIVTPEYRRVLVSGTASIHPPGDSAHPGDMAKQVELTMNVIEAILGTRQLTFSDTTRSTAFIKVPRDAAVFAKWSDRCKTLFPATVIQADICRDELLFELELDAIARA